MRFERTHFVSALSSAFSLAAKKSNKEAWCCVHLSVSGGKAVFSGQDGESGISVPISVDYDGTDEVLLPLKVFELAKGLTENQIELSIDADSVEIRAGRGKWKFQTMDVRDYVKFSVSTSEAITCELAGETLREAISRTIGHVDEESTRYALGGICFDFWNKAIVSTDGRRLAVFPIEFGIESDTRSVVPVRALKAILRECSTSPSVKITAGAHGMVFEMDEATIQTRLIEGRFPQWQSVVPDSFGSEFRLSASELRKSVKLVSVVNNDETRGISFDWSKETVKISSKGAEVGVSETEVPCSGSGDLSNLVDGEILSACLASSGDITVRANDANSAIKIEDDKAFYVVMPLSKEQ